MIGRREPVVYRFGEFELDTPARELRRDGRRIRLQDKPWRILTRLLNQAGRLVPRGDLQRELWPDDVHVDRDHGLNAAMRKLRRALGESASQAAFIETVPRYGYRFVAPVTADMGPEAARPPLLAVLPLRNRGVVTGDDYVLDGLTEELIAELGCLAPGRLQVIAHSSVGKYSGGPSDLDDVARELGVDLVLEGSVTRNEERTRLTLQLVRVADRVVVWSDSSDETASGLVVLGKRLADQVARAMQLDVSESETPPATPDSEAYDAYLKGNSCWNRRTPEALVQALEWFERAVTRAPTFAPAFAALAECHNLREDYGVEAPREAFPRALAAVERALELDPMLAQAYTARGYIRHRFEWRWREAEQDYRRAIEINPSSSYAYHRYAEYLSQLQRHDEAMATIRRALGLDPFSLALRTVEGWILFHAGRDREAASACRSELDDAPRFATARFVLGRVLARDGSYRAALDESRRALLDAPDNSFVRSGVAVVAARAGEKALAEEILASLEQTGERRFVSPYLTGKIHAALGNDEKALEALVEAVRERSGWVTDLAVDPEFADLRSRAAFVALMKEVGVG